LKRKYGILAGKSWIFSWAMSHICANDEYQSRVGATNRPENSVFIHIFFTGLSLRLRADIAKVTAHERIQPLLTIKKWK
jgi:hypothetical protein